MNNGYIPHQTSLHSHMCAYNHTYTQRKYVGRVCVWHTFSVVDKCARRNAENFHLTPDEIIQNNNNLKYGKRFARSKELNSTEGYGKLFSLRYSGFFALFFCNVLRSDWNLKLRMNHTLNSHQYRSMRYAMHYYFSIVIEHYDDRENTLYTSPIDLK